MSVRVWSCEFSKTTTNNKIPLNTKNKSSEKQLLAAIVDYVGKLGEIVSPTVLLINQEYSLDPLHATNTLQISLFKSNSHYYTQRAQSEESLLFQPHTKTSSTTQPYIRRVDFPTQNAE